MKSVKSYSTLVTGLLLLSCFGTTSTTAFAGKGGETGGGGDMCENRIKTVRDDIASWIQKGGSQGLKLPAGMKSSQYNSDMLGAISQAKVSCTDEIITIGRAEKTCKNYLDNGTPRILCNSKKFLNTDESSQYVLVHHEYAGLAQIEVANGEDSIYNVSNQISGFLVNEIVKKLAVLPAAKQTAGQPGDFDALEMLAEGELFYEIAHANLKAEEAAYDLVEADLKVAAEKMASLEAKNAAMNEIFKSCGAQFRDEAKKEIELWRSAHHSDLLNAWDKKLAKLKSDVTQYINAQNCQQCEPEVLAESLEKYQDRINKDLNQLLTHAETRENIFAHFVDNQVCDLKSLFTYDFDRKFRQSGWFVNTGEVPAIITVADILSGKYSKALNYLATHSPIRVVGTISLFGDPSSKLKNGEIQIRATYDWAGDNHRYPNSMNPIEIIQQSLK